MKSFLNIRAVLLAAVVVLCAPVAQAQTQAGRVLTGTVDLDGVAVPNVPVTLHRVTSGESGPLGSSTSADDGSFRFQLPPPDTTRFEVYFVTAEHLTVRYFGPAVHGSPLPDAYRVAVYDTASSLPGAIAVSRRDVVLIPDPMGGWEANEIIRLRNDADRTLVSRGGMPTWEMNLPPGATDFQAGEGELTASEFMQMGDRIMLVSALVPGEREVFLRYRVPEALSSTSLAVGTPTDTLHVFLGQPSPPMEISGLETTNVVEVQGERFVQYGTTDLAEGSEVVLRWDPPRGPPLAPELAGVLAAAVVLIVGSAFAVRARGRGGREATPPRAAG